MIVMSTVRCNREGKLGFVTDPRRLNVAISRPRRCVHPFLFFAVQAFAFVHCLCHRHIDALISHASCPGIAVRPWLLAFKLCFAVCQMSLCILYRADLFAAASCKAHIQPPLPFFSLSLSLDGAIIAC